jgi:predicted phosphate transport protein (TIGR00153 family)
MKIFDYLFRHQREIENLYGSYLDVWDSCVEIFEGALALYLHEGVTEDFACKVREIRRAESNADELRRTIEYRMYQKSLLPESRGDIVGLLEQLDRIPNRTESVLVTLSLLKVEFPPELVKEAELLLRETVQALNTLLLMARQVFHIEEDMHPLVVAIDQGESRCDFFEREMLTRLFEMELPTIQKLSLREVIMLCAGLTDLAENTADRLLMVGAKRRA